MKKTLLLGSLALFLFSCGNSDEETPFDNTDPANQSVMLPVKITMGGSSMKINYNGTKILNLTSIKDPGYRTEFTYTDDFITGIKSFENNILQNTVQFSYSGQQMTSSINKKYSTAGALEKTISYTYTPVSTTEINVKKQADLGTNNNYIINSVYTYGNGNMVKVTGSGNGNNNGVPVTYTQDGAYTYTNKSYAFKNVKGFDKIIFNGDESDGVTVLFSNIQNSLSSYKGTLTSGGSGSAYVGYEYTTMFTPSGYPATEIRQSVDASGNPTTTQPDKFIYDYNH
ncbi:hypothetical protein C1637_01775 [Chryseobacterium lactis]|uniref:DUF4595 domain-containing protein n=1 Tax=Chryseobacterium lactis TaxID=1241981 RepID=A0A3G6RWY9_CHRLC|nr:hypothetical protein [Chryseobacterium lactis]AZA81326.1 hypothetical protein EG342_05160 [Chryseobacterium lactis]AZB06326.1 hypothetical protein EG341_21285 [Chryseobacterium lactis]PNW15178.1 hypothetical protein C1637_01775 [Chryseobacterium lactis]